MLVIKKEELEQLADGLNPIYVNPEWDYETVLVTLAKHILATNNGILMLIYTNGFVFSMAR